MAPEPDWREPEAEGVEPAPDQGHTDLDPDADLDPADDLDGYDVDLGDDTGEIPVIEAELDDGPNSALPGKVESWRKRSATGAVLTGIAFGLQQVFQKEREEPAIIQTTSGDPPRDLPVQAEVEHGRPRRSVVNIRPWLLERSGRGPGAEPTAGPGTGTRTGIDADARTDPDQPPPGASPESD